MPAKYTPLLLSLRTEENNQVSRGPSLAVNDDKQSRPLTDEDPQQRPHDDHHHKDHSGGDDGDVRDVQQAGPQLLEALGLPSGFPVLPANLAQGVVDGGHLHRHICNLEEEEEEEQKEDVSGM